MKNHYTITLMILLGLLFLAACAASTSQAVVETEALPTHTATATATQTLSPTATATFTSTPTPLPSPTSTMTLAPTEAPSPTPTMTLSPTETPSPTFTPIAAPTKTPLPVPPTATPSPAPTIEPSPETVQATSRTVRIGLHGRNDLFFEEADYQLIREAKIETMKMMSLTDPSVFARIQAENPGIEFIVRLYDDRINAEGHPTPAEFAARIGPIIESLRPYATKFEIGNEPNHIHRYEGWGAENADAISFNTWFLEVYDLLKIAHPWTELGFPALATPNSYHRDHAWLELTREAINRADWLGVHCYWQTPPGEPSRMLNAERGLCFRHYYEQFPDKPLELTEFDNDNVIWDIEPLPAAEIAQEYVTYYQELYNYPYLRSASAFIMSSPDPRWDYFAWRTVDDGFKPVVKAVGEMERLPLVRGE